MRDRDELFGLPVVPFEEMAERYDPTRHKAHVALSGARLSRPRRRLFQETKAKGFECLSYVSSRAFVWHNVEIGENCFVFENNVLQYNVRIGDNTILWSGNHVGHRTTIGANCFISSHVVISGYCTVGNGCYFGVNSCVADELTIGEDCVIGMGAVVVRSTESGKVYVGNPAKPMEKDSFAAMGVEEP